MCVLGGIFGLFRSWLLFLLGGLICTLDWGSVFCVLRPLVVLDHVFGGWNLFLVCKKMRSKFVFLGWGLL